LFLESNSQEKKTNKPFFSSQRQFPRKPGVYETSQPVNYLMFNFPSQLNSSLSSGFFVERPRQVLLITQATLKLFP